MNDEKGKKKYYFLMEELKKEIMSGNIKPGQKLPSENELSLQYNLSRHTVRKAISILANDGFVTAYHGKGTYCSDRVRHMKSSHNIAVITTYLSDYIFPRLIQGMDKVLSANGYSIILKNTGNSRQMEAKCLEELLKKNIDGLIIEPSKSQLICRHKSLYAQFEEYGIPYVFIQGIYGEMQNKPYIILDDCKGGYLVTNYMISLGHRNILGVFKADDYQGLERHKGYVNALQEAGIPYDPDKVIWFHTEDRKIKPSVILKDKIQKGDIPDGIVCYNDQIAVQVIELLEKMGLKVPDDISVTGYDNSLYAHGKSLTTVVHPQEKLGEMAAEYIINRLEHKEKDSNEQFKKIIEPELIIRDSCKKLN